MRAGAHNVLFSGYPIIGRVHDIPHEKTWLKFYEWSKEFGPIYQNEMFGSVHVWISSEAIANDLLSRRAAIYSDRPMIPNLPNNRTGGEYLALHGHNGMSRAWRWRPAHRCLSHPFLLTLWAHRYVEAAA